MLVCLRCCEQSQWRPRKAMRIICVHITDLSPKWYICLHGVLEVRWSSLMKRSWETPWSWTLTGWPRQWNILFWNSMKMYQGLWRIIKDYKGLCRNVVTMFTSFGGAWSRWVQAAANIFNCPRVVQGSVALARQMELRRKLTAFCQFHVNV